MLIRPVKVEEIPALQKVIVASFLVPHGNAAPKKDIESYVANHFNIKSLEQDLANKNNHYYVLIYENEIAGFSKIIFDYENENINSKNVSKLERIYLLKEFYGLGFGKDLFQFNVQLAKKHNQIGLWLHVWVENYRAIDFYKKMGMQAVGNYNFKVSETHYNPNHIMYLEF